LIGIKPVAKEGTHWVVVKAISVYEVIDKIGRVLKEIDVVQIRNKWSDARENRVEGIGEEVVADRIFNWLSVQVKERSTKEIVIVASKVASKVPAPATIKPPATIKSVGATVKSTIKATRGEGRASKDRTGREIWSSVTGSANNGIRSGGH